MSAPAEKVNAADLRILLEIVELEDSFGKWQIQLLEVVIQSGVGGSEVRYPS